MSKDFFKKTAVFVIFMFGFFLWAESFPTDTANQKSDKELLQQGEELYKNGEYEKALTVFQEAEPYITDTNKRLILYFHMSLTYFALGNSNQAEESLRKLFGLDPGYSIIEENYPRGFLQIFNKIKAEIKAKIEAGKKAKSKEKEKIIEKQKPEKPKEKKKFPLLLVLGGAAVAALAVLLLGKKKSDSSPPKPEPADPVVHLESTPAGAKVYADSQEISSSTPADFTISSGQHEISLVLADYGKAKKTMNFEKGKTYNINVILAGYTYEFVHKWSRFGIGLEEFDVLDGIAVDNNGYVYVADYEYDKVHKFDSNGNLITQWGLKEPHGIAVDANGYIYVSNDYSYIYKFNSRGKYVTRWGGIGSGIDLITGIAIDNVGYVYGADYGNNSIRVYIPNGEFVNQWGSQGNGNGQFEYPRDIAIDTQNYVYVSDSENHRVQKFTSNGGFVSKWGSFGSNNSQFNNPGGISADRNNYIYVCDTGNNRVQKFTSDGSYVTKWGAQGSGDGQLKGLIGIAVDNNDYVYVTDVGNHRIQKFKISSTETDGDGDWQINTSSKSSATTTSMSEKERQDNKKVPSYKEEKKKTIIE
jgi:sugar lactone lactonase YvrE